MIHGRDARATSKVARPYALTALILWQVRLCEVNTLLIIAAQ